VFRDSTVQKEILTLPKKPKSKPAAKKAAVKAVSRPTPGPDSRLIDDIAARVKQLQSELKAINKKLDYCISRLGPRSGEEFEN
jgi:hypothetical protein